MALTGLTGLAPLGARAGRSLLTPQEEDDLLSQLAGAGTSFLGMVGNVLDTPGAFVRNVLAGENPLPGILDPDRRISGRELLERHGILGENYEGLDFGDVLGFGAEVATDPLTLVGGGTTKAGNIAKALGKFPKRSLFDVGTGALKQGKRVARRGTLGSILEGADDATMKLAGKLAEKRGARLEDLLDEPMQRSLGFGLPFKENIATIDLPGAETRAKSLDWLGGKIRMSRPGRELARMFDRTVRNVTGGKAQETMKNVTEAFEPRMAEEEAVGLQRNDALIAAGVTDADLRRNLVEGWGGTLDKQLAPEEAVNKLIPQAEGEDLATWQARTKPVVDILKQHESETDRLFRRKVELGLASWHQRHEDFYSPRALTRAEPGALEEPAVNWNLRRTMKAPTTPINQALSDPEFIALAKATDVDPLSPERLARKVPEQVEEYLENVGYDNVEELVDWQAKGMLRADPQREAMNYNAVERTAIGMGEAPELSRTVMPPKPDIDVDALNAARHYGLTKFLGEPAENLDQLPQWLDEAKSLPALREEWEELADTARRSDYNPSLPEQELAYKGKLQEALDAREQYRARKSDLDLRAINSPAERLTDDELRELAALRNQADRAGYWRNKAKSVEERIAAGEREAYPAERLAEVEDQIGRAEVARANVAAMKLKLNVVDDIISHGKRYGEGRLFNNDVLVDDIAKSIHDQWQIAWTEQVQPTIARNAMWDAPADAKTYSLREAARKAGAAGRDATAFEQAVRNIVREAGEAGTVPKDVAENIAGPRAVATSAMQRDNVLAERLRQEEIAAFQQRARTSLDKQIAAINREKNWTGAQKAEAIAAAEARSQEFIAAGMVKIGQSPLPDTSQVGRLMAQKQSLAKELDYKAVQRRAAGEIDDEGLAAYRADIQKFLKGGKPAGEDFEEAQRLWTEMTSADPIPNDGLQAIDRIRVPAEIVDQIAAGRSLWEKPGQEGTIGTVVDKIRQIMKAHFTLPHPGFHGRNIQGSAALFTTLRAFDPTVKGPKGLVQPLIDMWGVLRGRGIRDAENFPQVKALGLKGKDAERWVLAQISAKGSLRGAGDTLSEGVEATFTGDMRRTIKGGESAEQLARNIPGNAPIDADYFTAPFRKQEGKQRWRADKPEEFFATAAGARVSNFIENLFRGGAMIGLMRQGKAVDEAAALMKAAFVDYSSLSKWERTYARRVIPFYSWLRHASVFAVRNLMEQPAGFNAQLARLARVSQQDAGFLPPQLGGSLAIPIGQEEDGTQRYLSQFDFPVETLNRVINPAGVKETVRGLLSQTDPLLKAVIETGTGINLFRGRNLEDLESPTGRIAANIMGADEPLWKQPLVDTALANSPLSRYLSTAAQAGDKRKGWPTFIGNTLTGLRLTDQKMDEARAIAASKAAKELLKNLGARSRELISFSKDELLRLPPEERDQAEKLQSLIRSIGKQAKRDGSR